MHRYTAPPPRSLSDHVTPAIGGLRASRARTFDPPTFASPLPPSCFLFLPYSLCGTPYQPTHSPGGSFSLFFFGSDERRGSDLFYSIFIRGNAYNRAPSFLLPSYSMGSFSPSLRNIGAMSAAL